MLVEYVAQRLNSIAILPDLKELLERLVASDEARRSQSHWGTILSKLQRILGGDVGWITPFTAAWSLTYAVMLRLDHLQDGDLTADPLPDDRLAVQYNLIFSYYVLANSILDELSLNDIPAHRILSLRRFWSDMMLRKASGQHYDLAKGREQLRGDSLQQYQHMVQAKTSSSYALGFGGIAMLVTDDTQTIDTLTSVGEIYGLLLQYNDDILDAAEQLNPTLTLPHALDMVRPNDASAELYTPDAFGAYVYHTYVEHVKQLLAHLPVSVQQGILQLFVTTFQGPQPGVG